MSFSALDRYYVNVNRMESKFDVTKNNSLQSKYPPDIIGFCELFFIRIFQMTL
jgi:hypothetical protein